MWPLNASAAAQPATVSLTTSSISDIVSGPTDARAALVVSNDGITYEELGIIPVRAEINVPDWLDPKIGMSLYEVMVTNAGPDGLDGSSDLLSTWLPMTSEYQWVLIENANGQTSNAVLTVQIRRATTVQATADYTLIADTTLP